MTTWSNRWPRELCGTYASSTRHPRQPLWNPMQFRPLFDYWAQPITKSNGVLLELCGKSAYSTTQRRQLRWNPMPFRPSFDSLPQINGLSGGMLSMLCGPSALFWHLFSHVASADDIVPLKSTGTVCNITGHYHVQVLHSIQRNSRPVLNHMVQRNALQACVEHRPSATSS